LVVGCWRQRRKEHTHLLQELAQSIPWDWLKPQRAGGRELKEGLSLGLLTRLKEDKTMISVSLLLQPRAAAAVLTPGVECVALKELRALRARILPSNRLLDALDLSQTIGDC